MSDETVAIPAVEQPIEAPASAQTEASTADAPATEAQATETLAVETAATKTSSKTAAVNNSKFDPSVLPETDNADEIRRQVEYYFGDFNFPRDKFLWETTSGTENKPFPLKTLHTFKRMRRFQPYSAIVAALKDSKTLNITGEEGSEAITRKTPYKPDPSRRQIADASTVYAKGFGEENPNSQFEIEDFFAKFGAVNGVTLRRTPEKTFKGSVFVEFASDEIAKKFLEQKPRWKDTELKIMSKKAYVEEKNELIRTGQMQPSTSAKPFFEGRGGEKPRRGGKGGKGGKDFKGDANDWKSRREHDRKNGFRGSRGGRGGRSGRGGRGSRPERDQPRDNGKGHNTNDVQRPTIQATDSNGEPVSNKRGRDDDSTQDAPPAKKIEVSV